MRKQGIPSYYVILFLLLLIFISVSISTSSTDFLLAGSCRPNDGWTWASGPPQIHLEKQAQEKLSGIGINAVVEANSFGEIDSCGSFKLYGIDFTVSVDDYDSIAELEQQRLADTINEELAVFQEVVLGDVKIVFPDNSIIYQNRQFEQQEQILTLDSTWQQILTSNSPPGRYTHGLAYDSARQVAVLFGGDDTGLSRLNDTWEFNGLNWKQISLLQSPPGRANIDQTLVFDSHRAKTVLFGGLGESEYLDDTWEYDGTIWVEINSSLSPASRDSHAMAFDDLRNVVVLFGGYDSSGILLNDTWEYNGAWREVETLQTPPERYHHALAYDENRDVTILFGGHGSLGDVLGDTWEFDGDNWIKITPLQSPQPRENHSMVYDEARNVTVLFGGEKDGEILNDTWEYDGQTWRQIAVAQTPLNRKEMSLVYNEQLEQVLSFGGGNWSNGNLITFDETWGYMGSLSLPLEIFNQRVYVIVYDPILSGGEHLSTHLGWNDHSDLTQETIDFFKQATGSRLNYSVVETTVVTDSWPELNDGYIYSEEVYLDVLNGQIPPPTNSMVNYNKIVNSSQFNICDKVNNGEVDEVWIYNGPYFGFYESTLVGPGAYWYNSPPVPGPHECERLIPIMGPSPERDIDSAVHNFGHRTEATMRQVYGSWQQDRTSHNWERFALVDSLSPNYFYSGCGNIHYPPNGINDYDYQNTLTGSTNCDDFTNYPNLGDPVDTVESVTCAEWGCTHINYLGYWFGHLPSNSSCAYDVLVNDWWRYFIDPGLALDPSLPCFQFQVFIPNVLR